MQKLKKLLLNLLVSPSEQRGESKESLMNYPLLLAKKYAGVRERHGRTKVLTMHPSARRRALIWTVKILEENRRHEVKTPIYTQDLFLLKILPEVKVP